MDFKAIIGMVVWGMKATFVIVQNCYHSCAQMKEKCHHSNKPYSSNYGQWNLGAKKDLTKRREYVTANTKSLFHSFMKTGRGRRRETGTCSLVRVRYVLVMVQYHYLPLLRHQLETKTQTPNHGIAQNSCYIKFALF